MLKKIIVICIVICIGVFVIFKVTGNKKKEVKLKEVRPERGSISLTVETNGTVKPRNRLEIKPPIAGRIDSILVKEGANIKKGDIVAWMSSTERAALLDTARAKGEEELKKWSDVYKPTPIIAPLSGFIIKRNTEPGQTVSSADAILVMADVLILKAQVDETDMGKLKIGQDATIIPDAYPENEILGKVEHIAYESEIINNVTIYQVDIKPMKKLKMLRSGMSADIKIVIKEKKDALLLPSYAVNDGKRGSRVLVKRYQEEPERREIKTGIDNGEVIEIISGIEENDIIMVGAEYAGENHFWGGRGLPGMSNRSK
ncbi:MAG: efflux RND transporter periplasmic adaptor subunit [Elusimicrobia bacterium]|jgi:macrolide-specific efflux system membrane fusion protein|nr:efflux RND transporter periplasmic adaptor subunit [Elusimicrobiota bacterium]